MVTIVQQYGPIYGEAVNGTVQGRPNGSVFVPVSNTITLDVPEDMRYALYYLGNVWISYSDGSAIPPGMGMTVSAMAQDLASDIQMQVYDDAELTSLIACRNMGAGLFNWTLRSITGVDTSSTAEKWYIRAQLMNNNTAVATSDVIEVEVLTP